MLRPLSILAAALALAGCNTGFEPQYRVTDLRLLAIRSTVQGSEFADATPGDTVVLDALVANPLGRTGLRVTWLGCFPQPSESLPPCLDNSLLDDPTRLASTEGVRLLGTGETIAVPLPAPEVQPAVDFVVDIAKATPGFRCRPFTELVVIAVAQAEGRRVAALKRVRVTLKPADVPAELRNADGTPIYVLNVNPAILSIDRAPTDRDLCNGGTALDPTAFPPGKTVICGRVDSRPGLQQVAVCDEAGPFRTEFEDLGWQWYVTAGEFPEIGGAGNATGTDVDFTPPPSPFTLWAILRDGRGGVAWQRLP